MKRPPDDNQGELFPGKNNSGDAWARGSDPDTSYDAAHHVRGARANHLEGLVVQALRLRPGGRTSHELVEITNIDWNTITPRIAPLVRKGIVYDTGRRRKGPAGRVCIVWDLIEKSYLHPYPRLLKYRSS